MRLIFILAGILFTLLSISRAESAAPSVQKKLVFSASRFLPFSSQSTLEGGILTLLIRYIFLQAEIPIDVVYHRLGKWQDNFIDNEVIGHFPVFFPQEKTSDAEREMRSKLMDIYFYIYTPSSNPYKYDFLRKTIQSKPIKTLCVPENLLHINGLEETLKHSNYAYFTGLTSNDCKMSLMRNDCDGFIDEDFHARSIGLLDDTKDLIFLERGPKPFFVTGVYVIFNNKIKGIEKVKQYFDAQLDKARQSGAFQDILNRFNEYWKIMY